MEDDYDIGERREKKEVNPSEPRLPHYYGDTVRAIYLALAVVMVIMTPFFKDRLPLPAFFSILAVLVLSMLAGLTNPKLRVIIISDFLVALCAVLVFGNQALSSYEFGADLFFACNLGLAVLSVFALYFSSKTLRGHLLT